MIFTNLSHVMKKLLTFIFCLFTFYPVFSQSSPKTPYATKGFVMDSTTGKHVAFVRVTLKNLQDKAVSLQTSDTEGRFILHNLHEGNDSLMVNCVGHVARHITISPNETGQTDFDMLLLIPEARELKEVTIIANKTLIKEEVDRMAQKILNATSATTSLQTNVVATSGYTIENMDNTINIIYNRAKYTWYFRIVWRE